MFCEEFVFLESVLRKFCIFGTFSVLVDFWFCKFCVFWVFCPPKIYVFLDDFVSMCIFAIKKHLCFYRFCVSGQCFYPPKTFVFLNILCFYVCFYPPKTFVFLEGFVFLGLFLEGFLFVGVFWLVFLGRFVFMGRLFLEECVFDSFSGFFTLQNHLFL